MTNGRDSEFAANLRGARAKADLSQTQLAKLVDVDADSIRNWESGKYMPNLNVAVRLANVLDVTLDQLTGRVAASA